jgi:hypothetical protein
MQQERLSSTVLAYEIPPRRHPRLNPLWAIALGLAYAAIDIHMPESLGYAIPLLLIVATGVVLGLARGWMWFPVVGVCVFVVHVVAIKTGYKAQPYVEKNVAHAFGSFFTAVPAGVGAGLGVLLRRIAVRPAA